MTGMNQPIPLREVPTGGFERLPVLGDEFSRVLGGGMVPGSLVLIGGDPGIGKSTLLLQAAAQFADQVGPALYISAEELIQQIKLRATRMGLDPEHLLLYSETSLDSALEQIDRVRPRLVIVDSIQTVYLEDLTSAAGSVGQVREGALRLLRLAKDTGIPMFLVGHVTKEGAIAGPRVLEHIVDVVLYLEGERFHQYRLLRGAKNRFGSTDEVGVFEMTQDGPARGHQPLAGVPGRAQRGHARLGGGGDDGGHAADPGRGAGADRQHRQRPAAPHRQRLRYEPAADADRGAEQARRPAVVQPGYLC